MISRRLLRIKVLHILYAYFNGNIKEDNKYEKDLDFSIEKSFDLYHLFFVLLIDVRDFALNKIDAARNKRVPSPEDLNPNMRFVENRIIKQIENTEKLSRHIERQKLNWVQNPELVKHIYQAMTESDLYNRYMHSSDNSFDADKKFILDFLTEYLVNSDLLYQVLEEHSIFWNDDIEFVLSMNIKSVQKAKENREDLNTFSLFKNEEDREFAKRLFRSVINKHKEHSNLIQENIKNWDLDRIAQMDLMILEMAVTEITQFPSIPVKVSFNEYIDLAKFYSTDKSNSFVNGVLDKIIKKLNDEGKVKKAGRGLLEK